MDSSASRSLKTQYLILYNLVSAVLWVAVLGRVILLVPLVGFENVHGGLGKFAKWTQTLAVLEVVHSALGLVRSPLPTTLMQVSSRLLLIWLVVNPFPDRTSTSPVYSTMLLAWSVTEVIRYSYFVLNLRGWVPGFVTWLRYNAFYVMYPLGIGSECWLIWLASGVAPEWYGWALWGFGGICSRELYFVFAYDWAEEEDHEGKGAGEPEPSCNTAADFLRPERDSTILQKR